MLLSFPQVFLPFKEKIGVYCETEIDGNNVDALKENFEFKHMAWSKQPHEDDIYIADKDVQFSASADAIISKEKNLPLLIRTADCLAVMMYDPKNNIIANIHAGWRSQAKNIISKTIKKMQNELGSNPADICVFSGPSLGKCCAEFSDPEKELPTWLHDFVIKSTTEGKKDRVDFKSALKHELLESGIHEIHMEISPTCTCCSEEEWQSVRKDNAKKRIGNIIWMK
ncbi:peptidoglycan editing factor PgeF [Candidatus Peregrinibacteria bacterium]|jgi:polyphenol oxidase|nr:peptidoglycan editing factor PgeF [Candidatus Peregrinibacteria bacterium]